MLNIIVAISENLAIGRAGDIPWHIGDDLRYFKRVTSGNTLVMGRRTWESIGCRPLKNRRNIVVSRTLRPPVKPGVTGETSASLPARPAIPAIEVASSLPQALKMAAGDEEIFIMGGGQLYREAMPLAERLYVTHVHTVIDDADTFFPVINPLRWSLVEVSETFTDPESGLRYEFAVYGRE